MKCKVCGKNHKKKIKIKNGFICPDCYYALPTLIKESVDDLTKKEIVNSSKILKKKRYAENVYGDDYWGYLGEWNGHDTFLVGDNKISVCQTEIEIRDIEKIWLNFHPLKKGWGKLVYGYETLVIETRHPKLVIETKIYINAKTHECTNMLVHYIILGKNITYTHDTLDSFLVTSINDVINGKYKNLGSVRHKYLLLRDDKQKTYEYEHMTAEERAAYCDRMKEQQRAQWKKEYEEKERRRKFKEQREQSKKASGNKELSEFDKAKILFGLEIPYTEKQLKEKRNELIKKVHPDEGGTNRKAAQINAYYDFLKRFAL